MILPTPTSPTWIKDRLSKKQDKLTQGSGISIKDNVVSADIAEATQTSSGLMSADDKKNLEALKAGTIAEYVKDVTLDNYALKFTKSDGSTVQPTITAVEVNPSTENASYPVMLGTSTSKGFQSAKVVTGVTVNPSAKAITATKFYGDLEGTASKAVADADGNAIASTYAKTGDLSGYLPLTGGTMTGNLSIGGTTSFGGNVTMDGSGTPLIIGANGKIGLRAKGAGLANAGQINISDSWYGAGNNRWGAQMSAYDSVGNKYNQFRVSHDGLQYLIYDNATGTETAQQVALIDDIPDVSGFATKDEISLLPTLDIKVVSALPTSGISSKVMYLVPSSNGTNDQYDQYLYVNNQWEKIGSGMISVDSTLNKDSVNPVQNKVIFTALSGKLDTTGTAAKATADGDGNNIASTYAKKSDIPTAGDNITITGGVISATDSKVAQQSSTTDGSFPLLLKTSNNGTDETGAAKFASSVTVNPKTGHITATAFDGTASRATADGVGNNIAETYMTLGTAQTVTGSKAFTGQVGNIQSTPGVYLGLDTNASAPNANIAIVSANSAAYIDMGKPNEDYGFRIIKWDAGSGDIAQLCYSNATVTVPRANGTLALVEQIPDVSGFVSKSDLASAGYLPLTGGTITGNLAITRTDDLLGTVGSLTLGDKVTVGAFNGMLVIGADQGGVGLDNTTFSPVGDLDLGSTTLPWKTIYGTAIYQNGKQVATLEDLAGVSGGSADNSLVGCVANSSTLYFVGTEGYGDTADGPGSIRTSFVNNQIFANEEGLFAHNVFIQGKQVALKEEVPVVDASLSATSTNAIQNKAVRSALAGKLDVTGTAAKATADADGNNIASTYLPLSGGTMSGTLDFSNSSTWITPYLLAFKNADGSAVSYPYTGFYQWGNEWQVNARNSSNVFDHNILSINLVSNVATFAARPTVNGAGLALQSEVPSITYSTSEPPSTLADGAIWLVYE